MKIKNTIVFQKNWEAIHAKDESGNRKYKYIINEGSSRSSKTYSLIDCYDLYARKEINKRLTVWRDTKTDCKKTVLNDALKRLKGTGRYKVGQNFNKTESIFHYNSDSTFEVHGTDDEETVHGLTQDAAWLNEPYKISRDTFDQIDQRTSDFIFIDWNPKKAHWIEDLKKDPKAIVIHSTFKDNPFCPKEQRDKILSYQPVKMCAIVLEGKLTENDARNYDLKENNIHFAESEIKELQRCILNEEKNSASAYKWSVYGLGLKAEQPNRIFKWNRISDQDYFDLKVPIYYAVDWGAVDPMGIIEFKYYDGGLYLRELNYLSENKIKDKLSQTELNQINSEDEGFVKWYFNKLGIDKTRPIVCDSNRKNKIIALRRCGFYDAIAAKAGGMRKSIIETIDLLNNLNVYYTASSKNIEYEQENYSRKVDRHGVVLEEPEDRDNHLIDPSRYGAEYLRSEGIIKVI